MGERRYLILDFETRSKVPLDETGGFEYAIDPSTKILSAAWRIGTRANLLKQSTTKWCVKLFPDSAKIHALRAALRDPDVVIVAQNAIFEQFITSHVWPRQFGDHLDIPLSRWVCTAALAASHGLPRKLEGSCAALGLKHQKNPDGKKLIRTHCVPQRLNKADRAAGVKIKWNNDREGLKKLTRYCGDDVDATTELFVTLPPLIPIEQQIWQRNQRVNRRGIFIDRTLVKAALKLAAIEIERLDKTTATLTNGALESATQRDKVLEFIRGEGFSLPNLQKKTVEDALGEGLVKGRAARLLKIRLAVSKTSTSKYEGFETRTRFDSRLRDFSFYHGAHTGRDTGQGVQVHNLTKPSKHIDVETATAIIRTGDYEWARFMLGDSLMDALASVIRGAIIATPGFELYCSDYNAIEARVLFWMAGHEAGLRMFRNGEDLYRAMAAIVFDRLLHEVTDAEREVGKRIILGCGFGMGPPKFAETSKTYGIPVSDELAKRSVYAYRSEHKLVPLMWTNLEKAAIAAVRNPGNSYAINKTKWFMRGKVLYCELPSGRRISYYDPEVKEVVNRWGDLKPELRYWFVHPKTKQWVRGSTYGGKLTENAVQGVARDIMVIGQANVDKAGYAPLHSVYDELLHEREKGTGGSIKEFESLMVSPMPAWADGLPIKAKGWVGLRYRK